MLQIQNISKKYITGDLTQVALDDVSLSLRDNEFVSILGPSGSGKTTLLNIIGGLDRYDSGDLIINGISTKKYKDRDWDSYRNHTIGFVFQSYNLIPHQTVLANVELALTISGVSKKERRKRAMEALEKVGLGNQTHKKPNQMSGGQMQRVAIARALVNDPEILLADEPTGALDTKTSVQIMELLKEVAKDRLVVMVTHNPELAEQYSTRLVQLKDGHIIGDSAPYTPSRDEMVPPVHKNMGKSSMSFLTSLALSFNNLKTKKGRTLLTAFAGSIGIIGIALILSLSNGVDIYINNMERDTLSEYPLTISQSGTDYTALFSSTSGDASETNSDEDSNTVKQFQVLKNLLTKTTVNDLGALKEYFDSGKSNIEEYTTAIEYSYNVTPQVFRLTEEDGKTGYRQINPDTSLSGLSGGSDYSASSMQSGSVNYAAMMLSMQSSIFSALPENESLYKDQYDVMAGHWPENDLECVVVLSESGNVSDFLLYNIGLKDASELDQIVKDYAKNGEVSIPEDNTTYTYDDFLGIEFKLVNAGNYYTYDKNYKIYVDKSSNEKYMLKQVENGETMKIVGVVMPNENATASMLSSGICYPASLTYHVMEEAAKSDVVKAQLKDPDTNVLTGKGWDDADSGLDLSKMFSVDSDALSKAFKFDSSAMNLDSLGNMDLSSLSDSMDLSSLSGSMDMSKLDLSGLSDSMDLSKLDLSKMDLSGLDLSKMDLSDIDLSDISLSDKDMAALTKDLSLDTLLKGVNVEINSDGLSTLLTKLLKGYLTNAAKDPTTDYAHLGDAVKVYLSSDAAKTILTTHMQAILAEAAETLPDTDSLTTMVQDLMNGFSTYVTEQGITDVSQLNDYLTAYLQTQAVQDQLNTYVNSMKSGITNFSLDTDDLSSLATDLYQGYTTYAKANNKPDPSKMADSLTTYLSSAAARKIVSKNINNAVNYDEIQTQINKNMKSIMKKMMTTVSKSLSASISKSLGTQLSKSMSKALSKSISTQLTKSISTAVSKSISTALSKSISTALSKSMTSMMSSVMTSMTKSISSAIQTSMTSAMTSIMENMSSAMGDALTIDSKAMSKAFNVNMDSESLMAMMASMSSGTASYDGNLEDFNYALKSDPTSISIYPIDFDNKTNVKNILEKYNKTQKKEGHEDKVITYTDAVATMTGTMTKIIDTISYVLIAFVAISLIVSSIMIGIITYISVLERTKEIGILRAIGASKRNVSQVFNAETFIIGLLSGILGIVTSVLLLFPINAIIHHVADMDDVNAALPVTGAIVLIILSTILTIIGGLIPSKAAAKKDPVTALRTE